MGYRKMKDTKLFKHLISDENIYMALYSIESYVFNPELLEKGDKRLFDMLNDKFNEKLINDTIRKVRERIIELVVDDKKFVIAKVYFKPKKYDDTGNLKFRPLHIACIVDQIAIVSMLNLLIYEIPDDENNKIVLSNISRLIPSNFYGNRVSLKAEELFKPWKDQYKEYTRLANESFKNYHNSLEYKYEVTLDLENFFPSVSPIYLYNYISTKIPVTLNYKERKLYKKILIKLLYCEIGNLVTDQDIIFYYGKSIDESGVRFCRGIPQGLPQSYFFGNICMIDIADIFNEKFNGKGFFYVDDSVIFTNDVEQNGFKKQLNDINRNIRINMEKYEKVDELLKKYSLPKNDEFYDIKVHVESGKSSYIKISEASEGEIYLKYLSREASQIGGDMFALYSEEEEEILRERTSVLVKVIKKEIDNVSRKKNKLKKSETEPYLKKLNRYYKYFKYRQIKLNLQDEYDISEIKNLVFQRKKQAIDLKGFFKCYNNDIWSVALSILIKDLKINNEI